MDTLILVVLFVFVGLLILIMFLFLKKTVIRINQQSKDYFIEKLQIYDDLINEKEEKLKGLNKEIESNKKKIGNDSATNNLEPSIYLYDFRNIEYQDDDIFKKMKMIDQKFRVDSLAIVRNFVSKHFDENRVSYYERLTHVRKKFNQKFIYDLVTKSEKIQEMKVRGMLQDMVSVLDDFKKKNKKFEILKFVSYFDKIISSADPYIYVYVGSKSENYDFVHLI